MRNSRKFVLMALGAGFTGTVFMAAPARAVTMTFGASQDAEIFGTAAPGLADTGKASGMGPILAAGADGSGNIKRSLIEFNLSAIPAGATITGVTMTLHLAQVAGSGNNPLSTSGGTFASNTISLFDLLQPWTQGTSGTGTTAVSGSGMGFTRVTGDTSWDYASFNSADTTAGTWTTGSGIIHGGNFSGTASDAETFSSYPGFDPAFTWSLTAMTADVQSWVNGTATNDGWMIQSNLESTKTSFLAFWSSEGAAPNGGTVPSLTVFFTPEPASLMLLAAGLPLLMARRRRQSNKDAA